MTKESLITHMTGFMECLCEDGYDHDHLWPINEAINFIKASPELVAPAPPDSVPVRIAVSTDEEGVGSARLIDLNQHDDVVLAATGRRFYPSHQAIIIAHIPRRQIPEVVGTIESEVAS